MDVDYQAIHAAAARIEPFVRQTPILRSDLLDRRFGNEFLFKGENLQIGGSFKARGAFNALLSLSPEEAIRGVVTHSSGNHAGALALAAAARNVPAYIVLPRNVSKTKRAVVEETGAEIVWCEPTMESRETAAERVRDETGAVFIHPYNDCRVIAGQGTVGLELADAVPDLAAALFPVSGGGLLGGSAVAIRERLPNCRLIGVEPEGAADAQRSFRERRLVSIPDPTTVADGLRARSLGSRTFPIITRLVDDFIAVSEDEIVSAMRLLWESLKVVVEPSAATGFAAAITAKQSAGLARGKTAIVLSGGNVDLDALPWVKR